MQLFVLGMLAEAVHLARTSATSDTSTNSDTSDTCDTIVILGVKHNNVMMMYSKDKIHIQPPTIFRNFQQNQLRFPLYTER